MATDINAIVDNLCSFYDMKDKSVIHVGAGAGQLIGYALDAQSVLAVDPDAAAVSRLETEIERLGLSDRFRMVRKEFASLFARGDVVFFEFCLHEMDDPEGALLHAEASAPEILVLDHLPDSPWAWHTCEEDKAARSWGAARRLRLVREASFKAIQHFETYCQLVSKVEVLGDEAITRSRRYSGRENIEIEMGYAVALIRQTTDSLH